MKARAGIWPAFGGLAASYVLAGISLALNGSWSRIDASDIWFGAFELSGWLAFALIPAIFGLASLILYTSQQFRSGDLFDQSLFDELRWWRRWLWLRRQIIHWRKSTRTKDDRIDADLRIEPFGDSTIAIADFEERRLVVRKRVWSGWPDPPTYVVFAFIDNQLWMAWDFYEWPEKWGETPDVAE